MSQNKKNLIRIIVAAVLFVTAFCVTEFCGLKWYYNLIIFLAPYFVLAYDIIARAAVNIVHGKVFDENFLMLIATAGALVLGEYAEAVAVLLFYQVGELFQRFAVGRSRNSIKHLAEICPNIAHVLRDGEEKDVSPEDVQIGERIVIKVGDRIPIDGKIVEGDTYLDVSALTGESVPVHASMGDDVLSGAINTRSVLIVETTKAFENSAVAKILELVENASDKKARSEQFITVFARYYTPIVVGLAVLLAVIPSLVTQNWHEWLYRALSFLVVSCPCALVISIPMSFFGGIGCASKKGILLKGSTYLETINRAKVFAFDKTGTITQGVFAVNEVVPHELREEILSLAAIAEQGSTHPIAKAILDASKCARRDGYAVTEYSGEGAVAQNDVDRIVVGNKRLLGRFGVEQTFAANGIGSVVYVARNGVMMGYILVGDRIKAESMTAVAELKTLGCKTVMLSGDRRETAEAIAKEVGIDEVRAELLPSDKVGELENLMQSKLCTVFVGDGVNDAPVLTRADAGIAMGGIGSDAAIEAADVVITHDDLRAIPLLKRIAAKTVRIVRENIVFALAVKGVVLILSAVGFANMWMAIFADVGVSVLAILNAIRAMRIKNNKTNST